MPLKKIRKKFGLKKGISLALISLVLLLIVLPTFTPEDLLTTAILVKFLGLRGYIILAAAVTIFFLWANGRWLMKNAKRKTISMVFGLIVGITGIILIARNLVNILPALGEPRIGIPVGIFFIVLAVSLGYGRK